MDKKLPTYQDLLNSLKSLVDLLENGSDGWGARDYRIHEENVLADANEIIETVEGERRMTHEECEWLSECCGAEPVEETEGICSQCRDTSGFSCEEHSPWDGTETCPECGSILKDSKSRCFHCTASDYIEGEVKA